MKNNLQGGNGSPNINRPDTVAFPLNLNFLFTKLLFHVKENNQVTERITDYIFIYCSGPETVDKPQRKYLPTRGKDFQVRK